MKADRIIARQNHKTRIPMILSRHDFVAKSPSAYSEYSAVKPSRSSFPSLPFVRNREPDFVLFCALLWQFLRRSLHPVKSMNRFESMGNPFYDNRNPRHSGGARPAHRLANPPPSQP